jgi:hypothetical protein
MNTFPELALGLSKNIANGLSKERGQVMNIGTARKIFDNIFDDAYTIEEKGLAIRKIIDMETHNSITKCQMLVAMNWMWEQIFEKQENE